jgi:nitrogen fixation NifU-like protein
MSFDLRELYQEVIIDHNRNPRNHHVMEDATAQSNGFNPLCGDKLTVYLKLDHNVIQDISFKGQGCAISQASASLMTEALLGKSLEEAEAFFQKIHHLLTEEGDDAPASIGKLAVLLGVKAYPARVKCATLAWHTLHAALHHDSSTVKTE